MCIRDRDNALNAEIAQILLTDEGATVTVVTDGKQAVEIVQNNPPDTFDAVSYTHLPVFEHVDRLNAEGAFRHLRGLLYFTDGLGIYPKKRPKYDAA